jgi:hypothetical protein
MHLQPQTVKAIAPLGGQPVVEAEIAGGAREKGAGLVGSRRRESPYPSRDP